MAHWSWAFPLLWSFAGLPVGEALVNTYSHAAVTAPKVLTSVEGFKEHVWCARSPQPHLPSTGRPCTSAAGNGQGFGGAAGSECACIVGTGWAGTAWPALAHAIAEPDLRVSGTLSCNLCGVMWVQAQPPVRVLPEVSERKCDRAVPGAAPQLVQHRLQAVGAAVRHDNGAVHCPIPLLQKAHAASARTPDGQTAAAVLCILSH